MKAARFKVTYAVLAEKLGIHAGNEIRAIFSNAEDQALGMVTIITVGLDGTECPEGAYPPLSLPVLGVPE